MDKKRGVTILVIIAIILAVTAITLNTMKSDIKTEGDSGGIQPGSGEVGLDIVSGVIEDRSNPVDQEPNP